MCDREVMAQAWVVALSVMTMDERALAELADGAEDGIDRDIAGAVGAFQEVVWEAIERESLAVVT